MLRCVFWLSVMFASLPAVSGVVGNWRVPRANAVEAVKDVALAQAGSWCAARPGQCARDASRLTALVVAAAGASEELTGSSHRVAVALDVPARHRAANTVLTDGRQTR